jgi:hypothetical protein
MLHDLRARVVSLLRRTSKPRHAQRGNITSWCRKRTASRRGRIQSTSTALKKLQV